MKKFIAVSLAVVIMAVLLVGCAEVETETTGNEKSMFVEVEKTSNFKVVYHRETKVMYAVSLGYYNCGNFTMLVNADGTPMVWGSDNNG